MLILYELGDSVSAVAVVMVKLGQDAVWNGVGRGKCGCTGKREVDVQMD